MNPASQMAKLMLELRQAGITEVGVLEALEVTPREMFLPEQFKDRAFENVALPIGHHQTVSQPSVVGLMTQALEVTDRMKVLEIGTGSGYQAAVLARLCRRLYTIERHPPLLDQAEDRLKRLGLVNITALTGDGTPLNQRTGRRHTYRSRIWRNATLRLRKPPPIGVVSGPFMPIMHSSKVSTVSCGSHSPTSL